MYKCHIMAFKVMAWNLREGLAAPDRSPVLVEAIKQHDADVAVLSDAYWLENPGHGTIPEVAAETAQQAQIAFEQAGYDSLAVEYNDGHPWQSRMILMLSRLAVSDVSWVKLSHRSGTQATILDPETNQEVYVVGAHFDDRDDQLRLKQADAAIDHLIRFADGKPRALIGDLNSLHPGEWTSRLVGNRLARTAARHLLLDEKRRYDAARLSGMATSKVLERLEEYGLRDADRLRRPTFPSRQPLFQLDHCLVSDIFVPHFEVAAHNPASDHRAIIATLEV
jgi:endonuclease/exonuclease/phosphatase family metal-dependent hydrolase